MSFLFAFTPATYIFTASNCTTMIISLEPRVLNAEFQHLILRFNKNVFTLWIPLKVGIGVERRPKDRVKTGLRYGYSSISSLIFPGPKYNHTGRSIMACTQ
jgi:hypothetical protein